MDSCFDGVDTARTKKELFTNNTLAGKRNVVANKREFGEAGRIEALLDRKGENLRPYVAFLQDEAEAKIRHSCRQW